MWPARPLSEHATILACVDATLTFRPAPARLSSDKLTDRLTTDAMRTKGGGLITWKNTRFAEQTRLVWNARAWWPGRSSKPVCGRGAAVAVRFPRIPRSEALRFRAHKPEVVTMAFSHIDDKGAARMVDVGEKDVVRRTAVAAGEVRMAPETVGRLRERALPKGDVINTARIAGVMAAKKTPDLIPLCHGIDLSSVDLEFDVGDDRVGITATARANDRTGVEMEALAAVSVAALTVYDMCKAVDKAMSIEGVRLVEKAKGPAGP